MEKLRTCKFMPTFKTFKQSLLFGFMLATFLPLFISGYFSYSYLSYKIKESGQHNNELLAANVAGEISSYLQNPLITLKQAAILLGVHKHNTKEINDFLNSTVVKSDFLEIIYVIDHKKIVKNIGLADEYQNLRDSYLGMDLSGLSILRNIEYLQTPYWTHSFLSPISGEKSIALIYPNEDGYFFVGLFNIGYFHSIVDNDSRESGIEIIVLDDVGKSIFHPDLQKVKEQYNLANIQPFLEAQIGIFGTYDFEVSNEKFIGSTSNIPETKWLVMVTQPLAIAHQPIRRLGNLFLFAIILSIVIVVPLALRQSKRWLRPLRDLQENIRAVADGEYHEKIAKQPHEEVELVATHFRRMAAAIGRREKLLEINEERLVSLLELHNTKQLAEEELLEFALEQAVKLTRSVVGYLHFLESDENNFNRTLWSLETKSFCQGNGFTSAFLAKEGLWNESIRKRDYVIQNTINKKNIEKSPNAVIAVIPRQLSVPIFDDNKMVAVVGVFNKNSDYDATDARQLSLYISNTWDIIQQKRSDRDRTHLSEKLAQAQRLEAIGTLAGGIAHDFNNVLMVIMGNTELARDNIKSPEKIQLDLNEIFKGALRARDLVNQILAFSRASSEGLKPFDIKPIVKEAVKLLRSSIPTTIEIQQNIAVESKHVLSEPGQINQLIMNLCTNAYQAIGKMTGVLGISLQPTVLEHDLIRDGKVMACSGEYMQLTVSDTGKGIPQENMERLFEPYFSTREKEQGTGLGLAVVHGIVKSLNGAITVDSQLGEGAKFTIYLPIVEEEGPVDSQAIIGNLPRGDEHILYVDDDTSVTSVNSRMLESLGYTVSAFHSSSLALESIIKNQADYDLIITDMEMPDMTGEELARRILQHCEDVPVIICTGFSENMDEKLAQEIGVKELLMKPLTKLDLALTVRKVLGFR
jgi:signal transduction histidine kinase/HAMP domain-containing protein